MPTSLNEITAVVPSIDISCIVNGKKLIVSLAHTKSNYSQDIYHILFPDGYSSEFFSIASEPYLWADESKNLNYVMAIKSDLNALSVLSFKQEFYLIVTDAARKKNVNVCIKQSLTKSNKYSVHYLDDYRLIIEKAKGGWMTPSLQTGRKTQINPELPYMICKHIDATLQ